MNVGRYAVLGQSFTAGDPALQAALATVHGGAERPRCLCVADGVDLYVAKHQPATGPARYVLKRMPGTGSTHAPLCDSYEPQYGQSGLGALMGETVIDGPDARTELRLNFALTTRPAGECAVEPSQTRAALPSSRSGVKATQARMSLRALVHLLFERAGLNRWYPTMAGKRNQATLHKYLTEAARPLHAGAIRLAERLLVPEAFNEARHQEQAARRRARLAPLYGVPDGGQKMALFIGELRKAEAVSSGQRVLIRHLPELPLLATTKTWERIERMYASSFRAVDATPDGAPRPRLILAALAWARQEGQFQIGSAMVLLCSANWIPLDGPHELPLIAALTDAGRAFVKPLRYDAPTAGQFANALLLDTPDAPTPLHAISPFADARESAAKASALAETPGAWAWRTGEPMPPLPTGGRPRQQSGAMASGASWPDHNGIL